MKKIETKPKFISMVKEQAKIRVKQLLREANEEMVKQNNNCSLTRSYAKADQLRYLAKQIKDKYNI